MPGSSFSFTTGVTVRFSETDAQGIAHHAVYLVWFEIARIEYLARFGGGYRELLRQGVDALTLESHVRHRLPAHFDDRLDVHARCLDVRGARFRYEYAVDRAGERIADGWTAHACIDAETHLPTRVPDWLAEAIARAEAPVSS